jgi:maltooligosyltrehalose trehalohydrolase
MKPRRYHIGAEPTEDGGCDFRVWAPKATEVAVVVNSPNREWRSHPMRAEADGYFSALVPETSAGALYQFRLNRATVCPDPASRFQPEGPQGPSQVVDPGEFRWTDDAWKGISRSGQVVYEIHVGTFTAEGTWQAAQRELPRLAELGITLIEIMPIADFPGRFGWGYDGVNLFAPTRLYGSPDDFRSFVDAAHALKVGVILDVVYNHIGSNENTLRMFADEYVSKRHKNDWGDPVNFDGPGCGPVREYILDNATYWIDEYHLDGFRLDATQQIYDSSPRHILAEIVERVHATAPERRKVISAENEPQNTRLVRPVEAGGYGIDAVYNDDFHHAAMVALTGRADAYYHDHLGQPQEFVSAAKWGFLFQGQYYAWQKAPRGHAALDLEPANFVHFLQNHDQVANSGRGLRVHQLTSPGRFRALTALLLLGPQTPMLFQGQEFGAASPFYYFADHPADKAPLVREGRRKFLKQFANLAAFDLLDKVPDPNADTTFTRCKLQRSDHTAHPEIVALHRDLLKLRREDPAFRAPKRRGLDGAVLGAGTFVLRFFAEDGADRLLIVNLGGELVLRVAPEPLLAPPERCEWSMLWSSEAWVYGGSGHKRVVGDESWHIPGEAAVALAPTEGAEHG